MTTDNRSTQIQTKEGTRFEESGRKPYRAPVLTIYGPVSKLTMTGTGNGSDNGPVVGHHKQ